MSAVTSIVLPDGLATPVDHTFVPIEQDASGAWWFEDQSATSSIGFGKISLQLVKPKTPTVGQAAQNRMNRVRLGVWTPKLETLGNSSSGLTPSNTIAYVPKVQISFDLPERALAQDREDIRLYAMNLLGNAQVIAMIESLQSVY